MWKLEAKIEKLTGIVKANEANTFSRRT